SPTRSWAPPSTSPRTPRATRPAPSSRSTAASPDGPRRVDTPDPTIHNHHYERRHRGASMTLTLEDRTAFLSMVAEFMEREVAPHVAEYDQAERMPREILDKMADLGFFGGVLPAELGGLELDYVTFADL